MSSTMSIPGYYDVPTVARLRGVAYSTVTGWVRRNLFPAGAVIRVGRVILIEQGAVHQFRPPRAGNPNLRKSSNGKELRKS